jgi:hypothetical protein
MHLSRRQKKIVLVLLALVATTMVGIALFVVVPSPPTGRLPRDFSDAEKREISSLIRSDGLRRTFSALSRFQSSTAWRALRNSKRQSIWGVGNQGNGDIWIHVDAEDKSQTEGYQLTARYIMTKTNGHWKIGGSDL